MDAEDVLGPRDGVLGVPVVGGVLLEGVDGDPESVRDVRGEAHEAPCHDRGRDGRLPG
jgi:hypothetical protein